jgi:hypothetical protein
MKIAIVVSGTVNTMMANLQRPTAFDVVMDDTVDVFVTTEDRSFFKKPTPEEAHATLKRDTGIDHWAYETVFSSYLIGRSDETRIRQDFETVFGNQLKSICFKSANMAANVSHPVEAAFYHKQTTGLRAALMHEGHTGIPYDAFICLRPDNILAVDGKTIEAARAALDDALHKLIPADEGRFAVNDTLKGLRGFPENRPLRRINSHAPIIANRAGACDLMRLADIFGCNLQPRFLASTRFGFEPMMDTNTGEALGSLELTDLESNPKDGAQGHRVPLSWQTETIVGELMLRSGAVIYEHGINCWASR